MLRLENRNKTMMKTLRPISAALLIIALLAAPLPGLAADATVDKAPAKQTAKAKPYPLKTCLVSDEALGGDMGEPYVFTYKGREIKLCCKSCRKDFDKEPAKFLKKLETAEKKAAQKADKK
jgi:hypothetical protein